jgi:ABC-type multidrug transport system fused ATPase/permease subunit
LKVKPGQTVALVGSSGCGKSTIAALVERFYDPSEGRVMINGTSLRDCSISSLRAHIGYVNQEPTLFSGTIKENIAYGIGKSTGNVSFEKIMSAAKQANAHDFIMSLPDKYETYVGEKGDQLSGGQKQRIAIARSIFKDPAILLLDEATSALDNQSEAQVQAALDDLLKSKSRTTIVIAHRLSTIRNADVILVLEKGRIIEQGSHDYLINNHKGGKYWSLVNMAKASKSSRKKSLDVDSSNSSGAPTEHAYVDMDVTQLLDEGDDQTEFTSPLIPKELKSQDVINTSTKFSAWKLAKLHQPDYGYFSLGLITSAICGSVFPLISLLLSDMLTVFYDHDANNIAQESKKIAITLFGVAIALGISTTVRLLCFTTMAEKLAYRLRLKLFSSILSKDMSWFDFPEHSSGILSTLLSNDINQIKSASGQNLGQHVQNFFTLTTALIIALLYGKIKLTAWLLLVFPVVAGAFYAQTKVASKAAKVSQDFYGKAGQIANQAILSVKSVQALGLEETMIMKYSDRLQETTKQGIIKGFANGLGLGFSDLVSVNSLLVTYSVIDLFRLVHMVHYFGTVGILFYSIRSLLRNLSDLFLQ